MRYIFIPLCVVSLLLSGCNKDDESIENQEKNNSFIQQGNAFMENQDYDSAEASFKQAIEDNPLMPSPYFSLATIYQQYKPHPFKAIFYYIHFAEMQPESEKAQLAKEQIAVIKKAYEKHILKTYNYSRLMNERAQLKAENEQLYKMNAKLRKELKNAKLRQPAPTTTATPTPAPAGTSHVNIPTNTTSSNNGKNKVYTVVAGDTLSKIAKKYYGNSSYWDVIYDANRDQMKSASDLRVGQTLVIPTK